MERLQIFIILLISNFLICQQVEKGFDEKYFVGDEIDKLKGKYLIVLPKNQQEQRFGYENFYNDENVKSSSIYKKTASYYASNYNDLVGKKFLFKDLKKVDGYKVEYILFLNDEENNSIYFLYDPKDPTSFPFKTEQPIDFKIDYCSKIDIRKDKFTNHTVKYSPLLDPVSFTKDNGYYLSLKSYGTTLVVDGAGAIILLSNGLKMKKNVKIDVDIYKGQYEYSAFIPLSKADILLLTKYAIDDFKLYIFENTQKLSGEIYKEYLKCIVK